jgi:hypothetical protein
VWRELGDNGRAHSLAEEAFDACAPTGGEREGEPAANALLALAESALLAGDDGAAGVHLDQITPLLSDSVGMIWRIELRRLELRVRIDPTRAEELLERARRYGSAKYEALAFGALGAVGEATAAARRTGSPWLLARVAPPPLARSSIEHLAAGLPPELRPGFLTRGPLSRRLS